MRYDINNLLDLDYLNNTISQLENEVNVFKNQLVESYDMDDLRKLDIDEINGIFLKYDISFANIIQYLNSDFINQDWEFADLFADDIEYSKELEEKLKEMALLELEKLNDAINLNNQKILEEINNIESDILSLKKILEILDDNYFVLEEDIKWLVEFTDKQNCNLSELYRFSSEISKFLISKNKEILENKAKKDEREFETSLDDIYGKDEEIQESIYLEEIKKYYNKYRVMFDMINLGSELDEIMELSNELSMGIEKINSSDDFCISLGSLFYKIYNAEDNMEIEKLFTEIITLDNFYEENMNRANLLLIEIENFVNRIKRIPVGYLTVDFYDKMIGLLGLYKKQILENIFNSLIYDEIVDLLEKSNKTVNQVTYLTELNNEIINLLNSASSSLSELTNQNYLELSNIQTDILYYIDIVMHDGYNLDAEKVYNDYLVLMEKYKREEIIEDEKINLNGFVLFDFDEGNTPYVISDLDPHSKYNLIDVSILHGKCDSGFQDYSDLINDILLYGVPRAVYGDSNNNYLYKLITPVYSDKNSRKNHTGMIRIRPSKSSLVRFISRDVVLKPGTQIHNQVINLLKEILPNIEVDNTKEFKLVVNFASSMKGSSDESYRECMLRYDRRSPLYRLFFSDMSKDKLSEKEYDLLRDIIHMSLDAYFKLEKVNERLQFDIIRQVGGKNTYGK